jgi:hypothetical protein
MAASFASASGQIAESPPAPPDAGLPAGTRAVALGWITPDRLLLSGVSSSGNRPLRGLVDYDLAARLAAPLLADLPLSAAAASPHVALFGADASSGLPAGLYRLDLATRSRAFVFPQGPARLGYQRERDAFLVTLAGANLLLPADPTQPPLSLPEGLALPAPTGPAIAYRQPNRLLVAPTLDAAPATVELDSASPLVWNGDGTALFGIDPIDGTPSALPGGLIAIQPGGPIAALDPDAVPGALAELTPRALIVLADRAVELRERPLADSALLATLNGDESVAALRGRNRAGSWVKAQLGDGREGWLRTDALTTSLIPSELPILHD